ncbi:MAG: DUF6597 domain-containing transcriptional factor [Candidatus Kapaibacterium sp.]
MSVSYFQPEKPLNKYIRYLWTLEEDKTGGCEQLIFPYGCPELFFFYGDKYAKPTLNGDLTIMPRFYISGQKTSHYKIKPLGKAGFIAAVFRPHALRLFFDQPANEFRDLDIDMNLISPRYTEIEEMLYNEPLPRNKAVIIQKFLLKIFNNKKLYDFDRIDAGMRLIDKLKSTVPTDFLAQSSCLSYRQFDRKFSEFTGITPKQFLKTVRFQKAIYLKQLNPGTSMTQLALDCGYFDQAHFIKDFKQFTGIKPGEFFGNKEVCSDYFA